jgi:hypothetical protein
MYIYDYQSNSLVPFNFMPFLFAAQGGGPMNKEGSLLIGARPRPSAGPNHWLRSLQPKSKVQGARELDIDRKMKKNHDK